MGDISQLLGNVGLAHCRYPTAGTSSSEEAQPMYVNYPCGLALAHNGNLTNAGSERKKVAGDLRHLNTLSDSEVLLNVFGEAFRKEIATYGMDSAISGDESGCDRGPDAEDLVPHLFNAVRRTMARCRGGYAVVMLIHNVGVLGFRDPWGIRPLCFGSRKSSTLPEGLHYAIASESVAVDILGYTLCGDIGPGEAVLMLPMVPGKPRKSNGLVREACHLAPVLSPCIFEYVYFSRPDSVMNGVSVYEARLRMGENLARKIKRLYGEHHGVDAVIPIPDTACVSALQCAATLGVPYREAFVKNRYIGRTFIMPGQEKRRRGVRLKLNTVKAEFKDRCVLLVDDSVVRGTTSTELVNMALEAGAKEVCFTSAAPEVRYPNVYGIDIPTATELIADGRDSSGIAEMIGAKWVVFQDLVDLEDAVRSQNSKIEQFENSVFCGEYVTRDISKEYLESLRMQRPARRSMTVELDTCPIAKGVKRPADEDLERPPSPKQPGPPA